MSEQTVSAAAASESADAARGLAATIGAFLIWGFMPAYLKPMSAVPALEIMAHRLVWCCVFVLILLAVLGALGQVRAALAEPATRLRLLATAGLVSANWLLYVWAVNSAHVVEASLGYFINPLLNVALGVVLLSERLNRAQWMAVTLALVGVAYLTVVSGRLPWIALALACSFGFYGLLRKVTPVQPLAGLATETLLLLPLGVAYLIWCESAGAGAFGHAGPMINLLLIGSGLITAVPLALFAYGAKRIAYSTVGVIQYIGPTLQLLLGVLAYGEPFPATRMIGFGLIWLALAIYLIDGLWRSRALAAA